MVLDLWTDLAERKCFDGLGRQEDSMWVAHADADHIEGPPVNHEVLVKNRTVRRVVHRNLAGGEARGS